MHNLKVNIMKSLYVSLIFLIPFCIVLIAIRMGQLYGMYSIKKSPDIDKDPVGSLVGVILGLLAFMLAFTFQIASNHFDARKNIFLDEVANIRTVYEIAGLIKEPICSDTKKLMTEYVDIRVELLKDQSKLKYTMSRSEQIIDTVWSYAEELSKVDRSSEVYSLYNSAINDLRENYNKRIAVAFDYRIPVLVIWILFVITLFSMLALGYQFGITGKKNFKINILLSIVYATTIFLIYALDNPEINVITVKQKPIYTLQQQLHQKQINKSIINP